MLVGSLPERVRSYLAREAEAFAGHTVVVGYSGDLSLEATLSQYAQPAELHGHDTTLASYALGRYLTGDPLPITLRDPVFDWLSPWLDSPAHVVATLLTLLDLLPYEQQDSVHSHRMWALLRESFGELVEQTAAGLQELPIHPTTFSTGDVLDHFRRFQDDPTAIFCVLAPSANGIRRMPLDRRLREIFACDMPTAAHPDRAELLSWLQDRSYLWFDTQPIAVPSTATSLTPVFLWETSHRRAFYLYSNVLTRPAYLTRPEPEPLPAWPLAGAHTVLGPDTPITLREIKTTQLTPYKDAFLSKGIAHERGLWAYAVWAGQEVIGFVEFFFRKSLAADLTRVYLLSDFVVPGTRYPRLSKLMPMLALSADTRRCLERKRELRLGRVSTTVFTDKAVSMKYRGLMELEKRGQTPDGHKYLNYAAPFTALSWQETYNQWLTTHGSLISSTN